MIRTEQLTLQKTPEISRRNFLKALGAAPLSFLSGIFLGKELEGVINGYTDTTLGRFYEVYERHDLHNVFQDQVVFPENCQGFLSEFALSKGQLESDEPFRTLVTILTQGADTIPRSYSLAFSDTILQRAAAAKVPLLFGDFSFTQIAQDAGYSADSTVLVGRVLTGLVSTLGWGVLSAHDALRHKWSHRRKLRGALGLIGAVGSWPIIDRLLNTHNWFMQHYASNSEIHRRALAKIDRLTKYLTPENSNTFFRNLYLAHKLLFYAQEVQKKTGQTPSYLLQYHGGHSGITDFLKLGIEGCEELLLLFPDDFLRILVTGCGGLRSFCSMRAITLTPDFEIERKLGYKKDGKIDYALERLRGGIEEDVFYTNMEFATKLQIRLG